MKETIFFMGLNDTQIFKLSKQVNGKVKFTVTGTPIGFLIDNFEPIKSKKYEFIAGLHKTLELKSKTTDYNVFNLIGEPDSHLSASQAIKNLTNKVNFNRIFNPPHLVEKTSRQNLPKLLAKITGVRLARVIRCHVANLDKLSKHIESCNLQYPLIIRKPSYHDGKFTELVSCAQDLNKLIDWLVSDTELYLIEFLNIKNYHPGFYHKFRIAVVDGKFYPQHLLSSKHWNVRAKQQCMIEHPNLRSLEQDFIENFETGFYKKHQEKLLAIHKKIKLDYYGIDCAEDDNGNLIVFEANSCMAMLDYWRGNKDEFNYKLPSRIAVREALYNLITES